MMKTRQQKLWTFSLIIFITIFTNCRKDITVPNPELDKIFGTWLHISSTCGCTGTTNASDNETIEFNKNGIYKKYTNGQETKKGKFTLVEKEYDSCTETTFFINYKDTGLFKDKDDNYQGTIKFYGQDTLVLSDESYCYDGCKYTYIRQ